MSRGLVETVNKSVKKVEGQWVGGGGGGPARALETLQTLVAMERGQTGWARGSLIKYHTTHHGTRSVVVGK